MLVVADRWQQQTARQILRALFGQESAVPDVRKGEEAMTKAEIEQQFRDSMEAPVMRAESGWCPVGCAQLVERDVPDLHLACPSCGFRRTLPIHPESA